MKTGKAKPCILVVDDTVDNILLLDGLLRDQYQVKAAGNGEKALKIAAGEPKPDLIILDVMMPEMDGFEVCRRLKANPATSAIPVIFLTAKDSAEDETTGLELGAIDFISKPINPPAVLARVRTQVVVKQAYDAVRQRNELLESNLRTAARIQENLLPQKAISESRIASAWRFQPCESVGGDLLNFFRLDQDHIGAYIVDVSGHGLPAALVTFAISQAMQPFSETLVNQNATPPVIHSPATALRRLSGMFPFERFNGCFSIAYLVLDLKNARVVSSSAGHPFPVILRKDGRLVALCGGGSLIGMGETEFGESEESLSPGDTIFLYTDGVTELRNGASEFFGEERLENLLARNAGETVQEISDRLMYALTDFAAGTAPADDLTFLGLEYR